MIRQLSERLRLRFDDPGQERRFRDQLLRSATRQTRGLLWVQMALLVLSVPADIFVFGDELGHYLTIKFGLFVPMTLCILGGLRLPLALYPFVFGSHVADVRTIMGWLSIISLVAVIFGAVLWQVESAEREAFTEHERSERLLLNILPVTIADRLKDEEDLIADGHGEVTVLFADIVGFTPLSERLSPHALVDVLNTLFVAFDDIVHRHGLEKIKTIGDAYMAVSGLPTARDDHAAAAARAALDMRRFVEDFDLGSDAELSIRLGLHSGPVVAGVIGKSKFAYDLWGDTVNTASRMESSGVAGGIQVSGATAKLLPDFALRSRGEVPIKGKGAMEVFVLEGAPA